MWGNDGPTQSVSSKDTLERGKNGPLFNTVSSTLNELFFYDTPFYRPSTNYRTKSCSNHFHTFHTNNWVDLLEFVKSGECYQVIPNYGHTFLFVLKFRDFMLQIWKHF